jgi:hypothetical protein
LEQACLLRSEAIIRKILIVIANFRSRLGFMAILARAVRKLLCPVTVRSMTV